MESTEFVLTTPRGNVPVEVHWNSRRRTRVGMQFDPSGKLYIDAPVGVHLAEIKSIAGDHHRWIGYRSETVRESSPDHPQAGIEAGAMVQWLGRILPVEAAEVSLPELRDDRLVLPAQGDRLVYIRVFYERTAEEVLTPIIGAAVAGMDWLESVPHWRHRYMRSQWGSCSARGRISLNTHLLKVAPELIEYVVVHELCHLQHLNHSARFYELMDRHMPDWRGRRTALNQQACVLLARA